MPKTRTSLFDTFDASRATGLDAPGRLDLRSLSGDYLENETIRAKIFDEDGVRKATFRWQELGEDGFWHTVPGGRGRAFTPDEDDGGSQFRVVARYVDDDGNRSKLVETFTVQEDNTPGAVEIVSSAGAYESGAVLSADVCDADGVGRVFYRWQSRSEDGTWENIAGARDKTYTLTDDDAGKEVRVVARYKDGDGHKERATNVIEVADRGTGEVPDHGGGPDPDPGTGPDPEPVPGTGPDPAPLPTPQPPSSDQLWGVNITFGEGYIDGDKLLNTQEALDAGYSDYTYPTHEQLDYFASKGMDVIRVPFVARRLTNENAEDDIAILRDLVDHADSLGMTVLLGSHGSGPGDMMAKTGSGLVVGASRKANDEFAAEWGAIAEIFKDKPNVIFGLLNEPHEVSAEQWLEAANGAIAAIRETGATQQINVPGSYWTTGSTWVDSDNDEVMLGVVDPMNNYAYEVHQYLDEWSSGLDSSVVRGKGETALVDITEWARANDKTLFLGEFGFATDAASMREGDALAAYVHGNADVWQGATYWAAGTWWGDYHFSVEPDGGADKPQMTILGQYAA